MIQEKVVSFGKIQQKVGFYSLFCKFGLDLDLEGRLSEEKSTME